MTEVTKITPKEAAHAADLLDGIVSHPFWKGVDRDGLSKVITLLRSGENIIVEEEDEDIPDWGIPGDVMFFKNAGGYDGERQRAATILTEPTYVISSVSIGRSSATYRFEGVQGEFNTCMFGYAEPQKIAAHWRDHREERKAAIEDGNQYMSMYRIFDDA